MQSITRRQGNLFAHHFHHHHYRCTILNSPDGSTLLVGTTNNVLHTVEAFGPSYDIQPMRYSGHLSHSFYGESPLRSRSFSARTVVLRGKCVCMCLSCTAFPILYRSRQIQPGWTLYYCRIGRWRRLYMGGV